MSEINLPIFQENNCLLFALGRNAIYAACLTLGLKPGDEVLTPAFDCDGSLQPFKVLNYKLSLFRSDAYTFAVDIDDLRKRITRNTKLIHIINHFGFAQPWHDLLSLREEVGIPILEDNAYSLFSIYNGRLFGTFGDMSIFSLRKNLPLIDGGLLRVNNSSYISKVVNPNAPRLFYPTELSGLFHCVKAMLGYEKIPQRLRHFIRAIKPSIAPPPPLYSDQSIGYPDWPWRDQIGQEFSCDYLRPMSRLARNQLRQLSRNHYEEIKRKKRECYAWLSNSLKNVRGVRILWPDLPDGVIPFSLSFLVESGRDRLLERFCGKYDVMAWPTLSKLVLDQLAEFPEVEVLGRKLLQFNLPAGSIMRPGFQQYVEAFVRDITRESQTWLTGSLAT